MPQVISGNGVLTTGAYFLVASQVQNVLQFNAIRMWLFLNDHVPTSGDSVLNYPGALEDVISGGPPPWSTPQYETDGFLHTTKSSLFFPQTPISTFGWLLTDAGGSNLFAAARWLRAPVAILDVATGVTLDCVITPLPLQ